MNSKDFWDKYWRWSEDKVVIHKAQVWAAEDWDWIAHKPIEGRKPRA